MLKRGTKEGAGSMVVRQDQRITSTDGHPLALTLFGPQQHHSLFTRATPAALVTSTHTFSKDHCINDTLRQVGVLISSATGIPRQYYSSFAEYLVQEYGCLVVTFDYRGIGDSVIDYSSTTSGGSGAASHSGNEDNARANHAHNHFQTLKNFPNVDQTTWTSDHSSVLSYILTSYPQLHKVTLIGHSVGGHTIPILPHHLLKKVSRVLFVSCNNPHKSYNKSGYKFGLFFNGIVPVTTWWCGYLPAKRLGMFEDLPTGVAKTWGYWSSLNGYLTSDPKRPNLNALYKSFPPGIPLLSLSFTDDEYSSCPAFEGFLDVVRPECGKRLKWHVHVDPKRVKRKSIGHNGFFGNDGKPLWKAVGEYIVNGGPDTLLEYHSSTPSRTSFVAKL